MVTAYFGAAALIPHHPWFGSGTGSFGKVYADEVRGRAGVAGTLDATTYVRLPVRTVASTYFNYAATAGGAAVATTTDGLAVWLKTS